MTAGHSELESKDIGYLSLNGHEQGRIMTAQKTVNRIAFLVLASSTVIPACSSYDPVPESECAAVVKHAKKILGSMAPKSAQMMKDCKAADDQQRGCVMAATSKGQVAQCS